MYFGPSNAFPLPRYSWKCPTVFVFTNAPIQLGMLKVLVRGSSDAPTVFVPSDRLTVFWVPVMPYTAGNARNMEQSEDSVWTGLRF